MEKLNGRSCDVKKILHRIYLFLVVAVGTSGMVLNVMGTKIGIGSFTYYTMQSNALCVLAAVFYLQQEFAKRRISERWRDCLNGAIVMCIMLTFLVFHFLLREIIFATGDFLGPGNILVHYVLPLMVAGEYLFFQTKGRFRFSWVGWWALIPIAYGIFAYIYSAFGGRFGKDRNLVPYPFMDYAVLGIGGTILSLLAIAVGYMALCLVLVGLDKGLAKISKRIS